MKSMMFVRGAMNFDSFKDTLYVRASEPAGEEARMLAWAPERPLSGPVNVEHVRHSVHMPHSPISAF